MAYIAGTGDDEEEKKRSQNSISGEADAAAGGGSAMPKLGPQPYTQSSFAGAKQIFDKNKDGAQQYDVSQPFQEDLSKGQEGLKSSFGKLTDSIGKQVESQKVGDNDLADAIKSGQQSGGWQKLYGALNPTQVQGKLDPVNTQYSASDVASLNTAPGIQAAIGNQAQKKGVQNYTQGMGALDAAIYQGNSGYRQKVADLSKSYGDYQNQKEDYSKQATSAIEKSNKELADNAEALKGRLSSQAEGLRAENTVGGGKYEAASQAARQTAQRKLDDQKRAYIESINPGLDESSKQVLMDGLNKMGMNSYLQGSGSQSFDQDSASQFNNIMSLLNRGDRVNASGPQFDVSQKYAEDLKRYGDIAKKNTENNKATKLQEIANAEAARREANSPQGIAASRAKVAAEREKNSYYTKGGQKIYYTPGSFDDPNTVKKRG